MRHAILPRMSSYRVMHTDYMRTHVRTLNVIYDHMCMIPCNPHLTMYYHIRRFSYRQLGCAQPAMSSHASAIASVWSATHAYGSYKRVKGRSHTVEKRISVLPHKPHATGQPSWFSHTPRLSTDSAHNQHSH